MSKGCKEIKGRRKRRKEKDRTNRIQVRSEEEEKKKRRNKMGKRQGDKLLGKKNQKAQNSFLKRMGLTPFYTGKAICKGMETGKCS